MSPFANCLAVYDWDRDLPRSEWPLVARVVQKELGERFTEAYWSREGRESRHGTVTSVDCAAMRGQAESITYLVRPRERFNASDWTACLSISVKPYRVTFVGTQQRVELESFAKRMLSTFTVMGNPFYGIAFRRPMDLGPAFFAYGMNYGIGIRDIDTEESDRTTRWLSDITDTDHGCAPRKYRDGYLRDVFPVNVVSSVHCRRRVDGTNLGTWIRRDPRNGLIERHDGNYCLWRVEQDALAVVRRSLSASDMLI